MQVAIPSAQSQVRRDGCRNALMVGYAKLGNSEIARIMTGRKIHAARSLDIFAGFIGDATDLTR
jgi:hypothetical protein